MADVKLLDFLKSAEKSRQSLIEAVNSTGLNVPQNVSMRYISDLIKENYKNNLDNGLYLLVIDSYANKVILDRSVKPGDIIDLPTPPDHSSEGYQFVEWVCNEDIVDNRIIIEKNHVGLGALYCPINHPEQSVFFVEMTRAGGFDMIIKVASTSTSKICHIDWDDGTIEEFTSGTKFTHTYAEYGKYAIKVWYTDNNNNTINWLLTSSMFDQNSNNTQNQNCYNVLISKTVTDLSLAFANYYNLRYMVIPDSIKSLNQTFYGSSNMRSVILNSSISSIGYGVFRGNYALDRLPLPKNLSTLGEASLYQAGIHNLIIPQYVSSFSQYSLAPMYNLKQVNFLGHLNATNSNLLSGSESITTVVLNSATIIPVRMFEYCYSLKNIILPEGLTSIEDNAFNGCRQLVDSYIPDSIINMGNYAFADNYSLRKFSMSRNITTIGSYIFNNNRGLLVIDFSKSLDVPNLSGPLANPGTINPNLKIIVPDNLYDEWITATNWSQYVDYIYKASEVEAE